MPLEVLSGVWPMPEDSANAAGLPGGAVPTVVPSSPMARLAVGDDSPVVARVAESFARLDGQQQALAGSRFTPALETRVRLFQQEQGLKADGVVGLQTLFRLNERLGISPTAAQARARLETAATVSAP